MTATTLIVGKENLGEQRQFATTAGLERAIVKAGARSADVDVRAGAVSVVWAEGDSPAVYPIDQAGRVDVQLAWDMESAP